ncbi:SusC/RagA family TonB-linked outer membrane protein [Chitinophaga sancti]|uniref:SusC/RagA family TonB-linked outer membrane protein n=1 Tax=Chitinophaga sancti TaxID=1004 RepID=UPI002A75C238|nr:SusC/RagA family TonB-linked outer membrane protein [Chitinophaga sancti]WPQ65241.1 SusC/RagA family TonB-linked outer membrane protein [Chitinophaga sancti]
MRGLIKSAPLLLWLLGYLCLLSNAQNPVLVKGVIKDDTGTPLIGASVQEKGLPANGAQTNVDGHFQLTLKGNSNTLLVTFVGYKKEEVKVGKGDLSIVLKRESQSMNDVVIIGYQSVKRRNVTAAVSSISGKEIQDIPEASFDQMLQGRLAGVSVLSSTGEIGQRPAIVIRGATNVDYGNANGGNTGPLYVIDGVIFDVNTIGSSYSGTNPLSMINPNDIESIDVLKDASASAIYGARGGNGVIIVKTKRAKMGKPQVNIGGYVGMTTRPSFREVTTGAAERRLKMQLLNDNLSYLLTQQNTIPVQLTDSLNVAFNNDVDWQGLLIRDNAIVNSEDVSVAGYLGSSNYRLSLNHYNEQGMLKGFSIDRMAPSFNISTNPLKNLGITANILLSSERRKHGTGGQAGQLFSSWNLPTSFAHLTDEQYALYTGQVNPYDDNRIFSFNGSIGLTDTIVRNLVLHSTYAANNFMDKWDYFSPATLNGLQNTAYSIYSNNPSWSFENYLDYDLHVRDHHFNVVAGASAYDFKNYYSYASAAGINVTGITTLQTVPAGTSLYVSTTNQEKTTVSYYGRLSYDYKNRYIISGTVRRDASSIYSPQYRWGTFPSVSAGWIASDEPFFEPVKKVVSFLKFRASWGITGNDPGSFYAKYQALSTNASYVGGTTGVLYNYGAYTTVGGIPSTYNGTTVISPYGNTGNYLNNGVSASTSVRWEKYIQPDLGIDITLLNNRINLTMDWYRKDAKDKYFYNIPAQATTGYQYYSGNFVDVRNEGLEIGINTNNLSPRSAFQWSTSFNISFNKNYVTKLPNNNRDFMFGETWFQQTFTVGEPLFNYKVYKIDGSFANDASVPTDPITGRKLTYMGTTLHGGDPRYIDMNGDYNIDYDDKVIAGNPMPKITGGFGNTFTYKGLSLNIFCSFLTGRKIFNGYLSDALNGSKLYQYSWGSNAGPAALTSLLNQFWMHEGDQTKYPTLVTNVNNDRYNIASSYFVEDGSFLKIKQATLSYTLPQSIIKHIKVRGLSVYGMGENLVTFKKAATIPDPELVDPTTGSSNIAYPSALKFTLGVRVEL